MGLLGVMSRSNSSNKKNISKLKTLLTMAVSRLSILKKKHQARCSIAHADIHQLLKFGLVDRALLRAEIIFRQENLLELFSIIQSYCHLLIDRASLFQQQKECPDELKEAISSLIYASTRTAEMPEIRHVRALFSSMFGREFVSAATDLRNGCGVNHKIVQKLSTRQPSLESKVRIVDEIAAEMGILLEKSGNDEKVSLMRKKAEDTKSRPLLDFATDSEIKELQVLCSEEKKSETDDEMLTHEPERYSSGISSDSTEVLVLQAKKLDRFGSSWTSKSSRISRKSGLHDLEIKSETRSKETIDAASEEELESDTTGLLGAANDDDDNLMRSYYSESTSPQNETLRLDFTKKSSIQLAKVSKGAVSVRTRRGMHK